MRPVKLVILGLVASLPFRLASQAPVSLSPGQRIRLQTGSSFSWVTGTILAVDTDSLLLQPSDTTGQLSVVRGAITRVEISRGMKSSAGSGARTGFLIGAAVGALAGVASPDDQSIFTPGQQALILGVGCGGLGALLGAIAGSSVHERWERVSLGDARVTLLPHRGGLMLSFRL